MNPLPAAGPTVAALAADWSANAVLIAGLAVTAALYGWGMLRIRRRHRARPWPPGRAASFAAGLAVLAVALMSAIGRYDTTFFWVHMIQHLLLIMVAPALLIHGRPLTLAMHAARNPLHTWIKRLLRSRPVTVLTVPLVTIALYAAVVVGTHLTGFNNRVITHRPIAVAEQFTYLIVGYLYLLSGFGEEPIRWRLSRPAKIVLLVMSMPIDTFTGVALLMTTTAPWPGYAAQHHTWGPDPVTDVQWGGAMMWVGGDAIMIALIIVALVPWVLGSEAGRGRTSWVERARVAALDRYSDTTVYQVDGQDQPGARLPGRGRRDVDEDQARLDAYNAWLARAAAHDPRRATQPRSAPGGPG